MVASLETSDSDQVRRARARNGRRHWNESQEVLYPQSVRTVGYGIASVYPSKNTYGSRLHHCEGMNLSCQGTVQYSEYVAIDCQSLHWGRHWRIQSCSELASKWSRGTPEMKGGERVVAGCRKRTFVVAVNIIQCLFVLFVRGCVRTQVKLFE
jgi:hypothetical protein